MNDTRKWEIAWTLFQTYMRNLPSFFDEEKIKQYHQHVHALETASGLFLNEFKIPPEEIKPKVVGARRGGYGGAPGHVQHSSKKYADTDYVSHKIQALYRYLHGQEMGSRTGKPIINDKDYWSMSDTDLERLAEQYHIAPWGRTGERGEHWFVDRTTIIAELVKRDAALRAGDQQPTSNVINVGEMHGSSIQQSSPGAIANVSFQTNDPRIGDILKLVRDAADKCDGLTPTAKSQLGIDIGTIEIQIEASHPKHAIIIESLRSIRSIFEGTTSSVIASGIIFEISKLLGVI